MTSKEAMQEIVKIFEQRNKDPHLTIGDILTIVVIWERAEDRRRLAPYDQVRQEKSCATPCVWKWEEVNGAFRAHGILWRDAGKYCSQCGTEVELQFPTAKSEQPKHNA